MKMQKMSLANAQGKLSRQEMKTIMAGSGVYDESKKGCGACSSAYDCGSGCNACDGRSCFTFK